MSQVMGDRKRDEDTGRFTDEYPPEELLAAIRDIGSRVATSEIADRIGSTRQAAHAKLQKMEERGQVESQMVGGNRMWSIAEEGEPE